MSNPGLSDFNTGNDSARASRVTFDQHGRSRDTNDPPAYGDDTNSTLALPVFPPRLSESSRSEGSVGDHGLYATTTTTHTVSTTTTFFRLPRRNKPKKGPLFPLPVKIPASEPSHSSALTPRASTSGRPSDSHSRYSPSRTPPVTATRNPFPTGSESNGLPSPLPSPSHNVHLTSSMAFAPRRDSTASMRSGRSSPVLTAPVRLGQRGRSSTKNSRLADEDLPTPPLPQSARTSSSTTGRASLGGLFNLSRLRSEPNYSRQGSNQAVAPGTPISNNGSKTHSFSLSRESAVVPERQEGDTPAKYLARLEEAVSRGVVAIILSKSVDEFSKNVLRSYMRGFKFFGDPLDMSIRKLLMEVELPKETQQIDRVLQAFANRYHECNPGIYASPGKPSLLSAQHALTVLDEAYFIAFSILILHTDVFNRNNKHKMQKQDYTKNAKGQGVADEILECFYDNISYTPFIHVEDDVDINGERIITHKPRKKVFAKASTDSLKKRSREPVDPYTLILDNKLDSLRPSLKDTMNLDDPYSYLGTALSLNLTDLHKTFFKSGVLQIVSSRSRPDAFKSPETTTNPAEAHPGVVDIKVTKVGILWRKDMKKKKARSPWQEWGAILTGSQLYFFRNAAWVKSLIHQYDSHHRQGFASAPVFFKPPLEHFKPDFLMSTEDAVALVDATYKKHKNAFTFIRHGGFEEIFLADNEGDMNDWLAKLNYASAFRTAGVRMRGLVGAGQDGQRARGVRRMDSDKTTESVQTATGDVITQSNMIGTELAREIQLARRQIMLQKIVEADEMLNRAGIQLDGQLRNARHLQILAPIQNKTREQVVLAAGGMAARIKWVRVEMWRTRCHKEILAMDLKEEMKAETERPLRPQTPSNTATADPKPRKQESIRTESALDHRSSLDTCQQGEIAARPSTQPSPAKSFDMDTFFQPLQSLPSGSHQKQGSWELPPLTFEATRTSLKSGSSVGLTTAPEKILTHQSSLSSDRGIDRVSDLATRLATPTPSVDDDEQKVLKEAGLVAPDTPSPKSKRPGTPSDVEKENNRENAKSLDHEFNEGRSKVRRSLHRTLREAHVPTHHRSKRGKDSASSAGLTEDGAPSVTESEGLARGAGSFTVHGKKASVVTFGAEWQGMSPDERLKVRRSAIGDDSKLSVPFAIEDEAKSVGSTSAANARPTSAISVSTTTTKSVQTGEDYAEAHEIPDGGELENSPTSDEYHTS